MSSTIRTRFAPSPTGNVHIGNIRAAIYNWLFARHEGGEFLLRIEDTDLERSTPQAVQTVLDSMVQSMKFSRPEYWNGKPFPSPWDLTHPGIELRFPTLQEDSLPAEPQRKF